MEKIDGIKHPDNAHDYEDRDVQAAYSVLIELGQILKPFEGKYVVVGGSVPWLLLDTAKPAHLGTLDVDLGLDPEALADGEYASFIETLVKAGYHRGVEGLRKFQLARFVKLDDGDPIPVIIDLLAPLEAKFEKNDPKLVPGLRVQKADGCAIALDHYVSKTLDGKMPDGRTNSVAIHVATIPAALVMKGYALVGRDKMKDAYDIYFSIRNAPGGIERLAEECRELLDDSIARKGFGHIASKFRSRDDYGPETVRRFLDDAPEHTDLEPEQVQTDAYEQVKAFLAALGPLD